MAYEKQGFHSGEKLKASQLSAMEDGIIEAERLAIEDANMEKGTGTGAVQQKGYLGENDQEILGAVASGEGSAAFGGKRFDKINDDSKPQTEARGKQSFAAGGSVVVEGDWSAGFGKDTKTYQKAAFATGGGTQAGNPDDLPENYSFAHAEGENTKAIGRGSHAEGCDTITDGWHSHGEGVRTKTTSSGSHAEGIDTIAGMPWEEWIKNQPSDTTKIDLGAFEYTAHAEGKGTQALGINSHAEGCETVTIGEASHAEGYKTEANGVTSHAEGDRSVASGRSSHAEGAYTDATGYCAHAEGSYTHAIGEYSHAEGSVNYANGRNSHAEGFNTEALGDISHAEGYNTKATEVYTHAEGYYTTASGRSSHAEGETTIASGIGAHAEGGETEAIGNYSHTEGYKTKATKDNSHAEGALTQAKGAYSHAEGLGTQANGEASHAGGSHTIANGDCAYADGNTTLASGNHSHASGYQTKATATDQFVVGRWNEENNDAIFIVGGGTSENDRKNLFEVLWTGDAYLNGEKVMTKVNRYKHEITNLTPSSQSAPNMVIYGNRSTHYTSFSEIDDDLIKGRAHAVGFTLGGVVKNFLRRISPNGYEFSDLNYTYNSDTAPVDVVTKE